ALPLASRAGYWLVAAGLAMRRVRAGLARTALDRARHTAREAGIPSLAVEVDRAAAALDAPAARLITREHERLVALAEIEELIASKALLVDACRNVVRREATIVSLVGRPVLFALVRALGQAWPEDASRETLIGRAFRARHADESHRARLRVEIGRLRRLIKPLADVSATKRGFVLLHSAQTAAVLAPPVEENHAELLALLADGEAWSSSALALALSVSARSAQRALDALAEAGKVECFGRGRACRWVAPTAPGFPTSLLLPAAQAGG
ncbi:MAG: helix-turn-helix domain-containing protein, partial [Acetobacteraceae bacterium]|nr:helix-turn-helix domain-containing protein [Acetobacteraceae bacterium]